MTGLDEKLKVCPVPDQDKTKYYNTSNKQKSAVLKNKKLTMSTMPQKNYFY